MVHLPTFNSMREHYGKHRKEILSADARFAVIDRDLKITYYQDGKSLYSDHEYFAPGAPIILGTLPMLIDIGKETNSPEYQREVLESRKENAQRNLLESRRELADAESQLEKLSKED